MKPKEIAHARIDAINNVCNTINDHFSQLEYLESAGFNVDVITDIHRILVKKPLDPASQPLRELWQTLATPSEPDEYTALARFQGAVAIGGSLFGGGYAARHAMHRLRIFTGLTPDRIRFEDDNNGYPAVFVDHPSVYFDLYAPEPHECPEAVQLFSAAPRSDAYMISGEEYATPIRLRRGTDLSHIVQIMTEDMPHRETFIGLGQVAAKYFSDNKR